MRRTAPSYAKVQELTSQVITTPPPLKHSVRVSFVPPRRFAHSLVAGSEQDDADERDDQRECAADVPAAEHDAEVGRVPGEQHLRWCQSWSRTV